MNYEIKSKNDFMTGAFLIIRVPENELDINALYTIQTDLPNFILPFHYKRIDDEIEFTYKIGVNSKLQYFSGEYSTKDYTQIWQSILTPLLECGDWFMNPCSFILNTEHLYFDKASKNVVYIYVPTIRGLSGYDAFNNMTAEISKMISVPDADLENKVLRAVIENINPVEFINMLKNHLPQCEASSLADLPIIPEPAVRNVIIESDMNEYKDFDFIKSDSDNIVIQTLNNNQIKPEKETGKYRMFSSRGKRKNEAKPVKSTRKSKQQSKMTQQIEDDLQPDQLIIETPEPFINIYKPEESEAIDVTQTTSGMPGGPGFRYVGYAMLPPVIDISIAEGEKFSIGRFDATIGKKQSSFEFDKKTRAVSRRHAVIERDLGGYKIIDLSSSAGTFVNNQKLPPNTPYGLETGSRVSFGNSGADYVWEVS